MDNIKLLEQTIGFNLIQAKNLYELIRLPDNRSYLLDDKENIIGLRLYGCSISNLEFLKDLKKIEYLSLNNNEIETINFLSDKVHLKELILANNKIISIRPLAKLVHIHTLDLRFNKINDISALSNLKNLNDIDLRGNLISDISPLLDYIKKGMVLATKGYIFKAINLASNDIDPVLLDIIDRGREAIIRHFERLQDEGSDYIYEAKLTLVGDGSAGKTSLQVRLLDDRDELPKSESRTRGIKIHDWQFKEINNKEYIAHIWDFGGQDVYYPVHRFFITENSVFVLVASTRQPYHNFDYWIPTIFQFGGESPIIIVQTCFDGNKKNWTEVNSYLTSNSFNIVKTQRYPYYELDLPNNNYGLTELKNVIIDQMVNLKHFGKKVPKSWILIRKAIFDKAELIACIPFEIFAEICNVQDVNNKLSFVDIEDIADFFHSLGIILWYRNVNELKDWVILKPEWSMNAVYKIIDDIDIQKKMGNIDQNDFNRIWNEDIYKHKHSILKKMLEVFKIAFSRKDKPNEYIIPARLEPILDELVWKPNSSLLSIQYNFMFMPKGLINQISADLSRLVLSSTSIWNNAVIFQDKEQISQAQVVEDFFKKTIILKAKGKEARALIKIIMNSISNIIDEYKGVKYNIMIPCTCPVCEVSDEPVLFSYEKLLDWLMKKNIIRCNESDTDILISELLFQAGLSEIKKEQVKINNKLSALKAFISYSKFDGEECIKRDGINYLELFKETMSPLIKHKGLIRTWDDTKLIAGENWDKRIKEELNSADVIFLLVSSSFLNTNYIIDTELQIAFEREERGECLVIPILIKESGWEDIGWIAKNNAIPRKGKNLSSWKSSYASFDAAWKDIYIEVKKAIEKFLANK